MISVFKTNDRWETDRKHSVCLANKLRNVYTVDKIVYQIFNVQCKTTIGFIVKFKPTQLCQPSWQLPIKCKSQINSAFIYCIQTTVVRTYVCRLITHILTADCVLVSSPIGILTCAGCIGIHQETCWTNFLLRRTVQRAKDLWLTDYKILLTFCSKKDLLMIRMCAMEFCILEYLFAIALAFFGFFSFFVVLLSFSDVVQVGNQIRCKDKGGQLRCCSLSNEK